MKKTARYFLMLLTLCLLFLATAYAVLYVKNNSDTAVVTESELEVAFERGAGWLLDNEAVLMDTHIPALWEILIEAAEASGHEGLRRLGYDYRRKNRVGYRGGPLAFQVYGDDYADYASVDLSIYPYYDLLMMYAYSCDDLLAQLETVQAQLDSDFCDRSYPLSPACKTHQLMGFSYFRGNQCRDKKLVEGTIHSLLNDIRKQLQFDVRVVDVYLQRVMMLLRLAGEEHGVRQAWLRQIVDAQNDDGGWDDFMPLIAVGNGRSIGFSKRAIKIARPASDFHATVQAVLLLALVHDES